MEAESTIRRVAERVSRIRGVQAVVLGGSRARGTHTASSDIDIGLYYDGELDIDALQAAASELDDAHRSGLVTKIGGWGPWVNGGGWLTVDGIAVDLLYRDVRRVSQVIDQCLAGDVTIDLHPGHPHGFVNAMYLAEVALCQAIKDPGGVLQTLKSKTAPYPPALRQALMDRFMWEAGFSADIGRKGIARLDLSYIAGCWFRAISCMNQVLFALNECYWMNEKGAVGLTDTFEKVPPAYGRRVDKIISGIAADEEQLEVCIVQLQKLIQETEALRCEAT